MFNNPKTDTILIIQFLVIILLVLLISKKYKLKNSIKETFSDDSVITINDTINFTQSELKKLQFNIDDDVDDVYKNSINYFNYDVLNYKGIYNIKSIKKENTGTLYVILYSGKNFDKNSEIIISNVDPTNKIDLNDYNFKSFQLVNSEDIVYKILEKRADDLNHIYLIESKETDKLLKVIIINIEKVEKRCINQTDDCIKNGINIKKIIIPRNEGINKNRNIKFTLYNTEDNQEIPYTQTTSSEIKIIPDSYSIKPDSLTLEYEIAKDILDKNIYGLTGLKKYIGNKTGNGYKLVPDQKNDIIEKISENVISSVNKKIGNIYSKLNKMYI